LSQAASQPAPDLAPLLTVEAEGAGDFPTEGSEEGGAEWIATIAGT